MSYWTNGRCWSARALRSHIHTHTGEVRAGVDGPWVDFARIIFVTYISETGLNICANILVETASARNETAGRMSKVQGGMKCVKYLLFVFNFIFWVSAMKSEGWCHACMLWFRVKWTKAICCHLFVLLWVFLSTSLWCSFCFNSKMCYYAAFCGL